MKINFVGRQITRSLAALCLGGAALLGAVSSYASTVLSSGSGYLGGTVLLSLTESNSALEITGVTFNVYFDTGLSLASISVFDVDGAFNQDSTDAVLPLNYVSGIGVSIGAFDPIGRIEFEFVIDSAPLSGNSFAISVNCPLAGTQGGFDYCAGPDYLPDASATITLQTPTQGTVPEPASLALLAGGLLGLAAVSRRRQRKL